MDIKNIIIKPLAIMVLISSMTLISCSGKLYTGNSRQENEVYTKYKSRDSILQDPSIPSPYTEKYKTKQMEKHFIQ